MQQDQDSANDPADFLPDLEQRYLVHDPRGIRRILQALLDGRSLISAALPSGGLSCPTAILGIGEDHVLIDGHHQDAMNQRIASADQLLCTSQLEQVRIQFRLRGLVRVQENSYTAFRAPLPEKVLELQRRNLYRVTVPAGEPLLCGIPLPGEDGPGEMAELRVHDISGGGLALAVPEALAGVFRARAEFDGCLLHLPDAAPLSVRLAVCHLYTRTVRNAMQFQAGCRFIGLPRQAENMIQHYIFRVDRQRTARERRAV